MLLIPMVTWNLSHLTSLKHLTLFILHKVIIKMHFAARSLFTKFKSTCVSSSKMCFTLTCRVPYSYYCLNALKTLGFIIIFFCCSLIIQVFFQRFFSLGTKLFLSYIFSGKPISVPSFVNLIQPKYTQGIQYIHIGNN